MRKIFTTFLLVFSLSVCEAQQLNPPSVEWYKVYGGSQTDRFTSIQPTPDGGYILTGYTNSSDGDIPGGHPYYDQVGNYANSDDAMIIKIDSVGNLEWSKNYGGSGWDLARKAYPTYDGGYIFGGTTASHDGDALPIHCDSAFDFLGGFDSCEYRADYWVVKLDHLGNIEWSKQFGGPGDDNLLSFIPTSHGCYYLSGSASSGTVYSDEGDISNPSGLNFCWILKIDSIGNIIWEKSYGNNWQLIGCHSKMANDGSGLICKSRNLEWGTYSDGGDVANSNYQNVPGLTNIDASWIFKIDTSGNILWSSVLIPTPIVGSSGPAFHIPLNNGKIFLSIAQNDITCNHNIWYPTLNENGIMIDSFMHSCPIYPFDETAHDGIESDDSLIIFTYRNFIEKFDLVGNLIWRSTFHDSSYYYSLYLNNDGSLMADGLTYSNLAVHGMQDAIVVKFKNDIGCLPNDTYFTETICQGEIYNFNGVNLNATGIYFDTLNANNGCDSIVNLNLTVETINTNIQQSNDTLTVNGSNVQWFDCNTQQIITGATGNSFIPSTSGIYAAVITDGNCSDTTSCIQIFTSVNDLSLDHSQFTIYPNPTDENVTVQLSQPCSNCRIEISNTLGQIVYEEQTNSQLSIINCQSFPAGIYFVALRSDKINAMKKLVKN